MQNVKLRLDAWRDAERCRDGFALGSSEWQGAEADAQSAATAFHAELAQASARYAEEEYQDRNPRFAQLNGRTSRAGDGVVDASLARPTQRWSASPISTGRPSMLEPRSLSLVAADPAR